jgi:hypothetical protein
MYSFYELTTLACAILSVSEASTRARAFISEDGAAGEFLGCWRTEIGHLGRLLLLRGFETAKQLSAERRRALFSVDPFHAAGVVTALSMESYAPLPFLPPIQPGPMEGIYEFRTYHLKPGGLPPMGSGRLREARNRSRKQLRRLPCRRNRLRFVDVPISRVIIYSALVLTIGPSVCAEHSTRDLF